MNSISHLDCLKWQHEEASGLPNVSRGTELHVRLAQTLVPDVVDVYCSEDNLEDRE